MVSSVTFGPTEQLKPITSTGHSSSRRVNASVSVPSGRLPKSSMVTCATMTISPPAASRAASDRLAQLVEVGEGLEDQQIDPGLDQRLGLLAERRARLGERGAARAARCARPAARSSRPRRPARRPPRAPAARPAWLMAFSFSA